MVNPDFVARCILRRVPISPEPLHLPPMHDFASALATAFTLLASFDSELIEIVGLSLRVSLSASLIAMAVGAPLGGALAVCRFPGKQAVVVLANALLGLPPVVAGLAIYLLLTRSGPLGFAGL